MSMAGEATREEKREYLAGRSRAWRREDEGKYVLVRDPFRNQDMVPVLYLVDRRKTRDYWWSADADFAARFTSLEMATRQRRKYKFGNVRVMRITSAMAEGGS